MMEPKILNTREIKKITNLLNSQFGFSDKLDYVFTQTEKGKIYLLNKDLSKIDFKQLRINKWGLYFGELKNNQLRLSIEGAQLISKKIKKNVVKLTKEEVLVYFKGEDLEKDLNLESNPFVILQYGNDTIGCAKYKEKKILNHLPKIHRTNDLIIK